MNLIQICFATIPILSNTPLFQIDWHGKVKKVDLTQLDLGREAKWNGKNI